MWFPAEPLDLILIQQTGDVKMRPFQVADIGLCYHLCFTMATDNAQISGIAQSRNLILLQLDASTARRP